MTVHTDCRSHGATQQVRHIQTNGWKEKWWENDAVDIFVSLRMILPLLDALGTKLQLQTHIATNRSLALNFWLKKWKSLPSFWSLLQNRRHRCLLIAAGHTITNFYLVSYGYINTYNLYLHTFCNKYRR